MAAALALACGASLVALEVEDRWPQEEPQGNEVAVAASVDKGSSFAQTGFKMGPQIHAGLLSESPARRPAGRWLGGWVRGALGTVLGLCLAVSYTGLPGLSDLPLQGPCVAAKAPEGDLGVSALGLEALQLLSESEGMARNEGEGATLPPPPGLGFERGPGTAAAPWLAKLGPLPEEASTEASTEQEEELLPRPRRATGAPGRGEMTGLFRETRKAFQEATAELAAEELRRAYGSLFRDTRRALAEADAELAIEEWRQGGAAAQAVGVGVWQ